MAKIKSINMNTTSSTLNTLQNICSTNANIVNGSHIITSGSYSIYDSPTIEYAVCIEKLVSYPEDTKHVLEKLLFKYIDNNYNSLVFNTLISYGILEDKDCVERKAKITNILK